MTLTRVSGHGGEREIVQRYRADTVLLEFHEKVKIEMACSEPFVEPTIEAILSAARTGGVGDGKIFVQPLEQVIRIRTGERNNSALTPVTADEVQRAAPAISAGDTAWVLVSSGLVMLMMPGLALFYGGLVRGKSSLNTLMMTVAALGVVTVQWVLGGYSLAFSPRGPWLGGVAWWGVAGGRGGAQPGPPAPPPPPPL